MEYDAYWVSPSGEIIGIDRRHINFMSQDPEKFGITADHIQSLYKKYNERPGQEGKAREELMIDAMKNGWLRARHTDNRGWIIQSYAFNKRDKDNIWDFIEKMYSRGDIRKNTPVAISSVQNNQFVSSSAGQILKGDIYESNEYLTEKEKIEKSMSSGKIIKLKELLVNEQFKSIITEVKLSRIWQYVTDDTSTFGIVSAYRGENSPQENEMRSKELFSSIRNKYGYIPMQGGFVENGSEVLEKSFFIPNVSKQDLINWGMKYNQYSVIYKENDQFYEIGTNSDSGVNKTLNKFSADVRGGLNFTKELIKKYFSSLLYGPHKGRKFNFSLAEQEASSYNRIAYNNSPLKWNIVLKENLIKIKK